MNTDIIIIIVGICQLIVGLILGYWLRGCVDKSEKQEWMTDDGIENQKKLLEYLIKEK
jgi:uncharacterized protein YneF (UPF0154 family)